jgi:hypothetical protein
MRISKVRPASAAAAACLVLSVANSPSAQSFEMKVLSGRPDMVSGGSALVQISGPSLDALKVRLNGHAMPSMFRPGRIAGTLLGRVEGLNPGAHLQEVSDRHGAQKLIRRLDSTLSA